MNCIQDLGGERANRCLLNVCHCIGRSGLQHSTALDGGGYQRFIPHVNLGDTGIFLTYTTPSGTRTDQPVHDRSMQMVGYRGRHANHQPRVRDL
jgi:hypothetical protein